jgi:hypothetical protein
VNESLKHSGPIFGSIAALPKRSQRKLVGCFDGEVELAVGIYAFILSVGQPSACRLDHSLEFPPRSGLDLEPPDLYEVVEFVVAHS